MCRPFRLSRALPVQHAGLNVGSGGCHPSSLSLRDRSRSNAVANVRSLVPVRDHLRHVSRPTSLFPFHLLTCSSLSARLLCNIVASRRAYSQNISAHPVSSLSAGDTTMAAPDTLNTDAKPADILNGDTNLPAGRAEGSLDPESDEEVPVEADELKDALGRPPPVNSDYLPLPWKGRLGYVSRYTLQCSNFIYFHCNINNSGLLEYLSTLLNTARLLLSNLSHRFNPRKPTPSSRPRTTPTLYKESS